MDTTNINEQHEAYLQEYDRYFVGLTKNNFSLPDRLAKLSVTLSDQLQRTQMSIVSDLVGGQLYDSNINLGPLFSSNLQNSEHTLLGSMRVEHDLWNLVRIIQQYDFGNNIPEKIQFPVDTIAHFQRKQNCDNLCDRKIVLLQYMNEWLGQNYTLGAHLRVPAAAAQRARHLDRNVETDMIWRRDEDGQVLADLDMYACTRQHINSSDLDLDTFVSKIVKSCSDGYKQSHVHQEDVEAANDLSKSIWTAVRSNNHILMENVMCAFGEQWRIAVAKGDCLSVDSSNIDLDNSFQWKNLGNDTDPNLNVMMRFGNSHLESFRYAVREYSKYIMSKIKDYPKKSKAKEVLQYEAAFAAIMANDIELLTHNDVLTSWQDQLWATIRCYIGQKSSESAKENVVVSSDLPYSNKRNRKISSTIQTRKIHISTPADAFSQARSCFGKTVQTSRETMDSSTLTSSTNAYNTKRINEHVDQACCYIAEALINFAYTPESLPDLLHALNKHTGNLSVALDQSMTHLLQPSAHIGKTTTNISALGASAPPSLLFNRTETSYDQLFVPLRRFAAFFVLFLRDTSVLCHQRPPNSESHPYHNPVTKNQNIKDAKASFSLLDDPNTSSLIWKACDAIIARYAECLLRTNIPESAVPLLARMSAMRAVHVFAGMIQRLPQRDERHRVIRNGWKFIPGLMPNALRLAAHGLISLPSKQTKTSIDDEELRTAVFSNIQSDLLPQSPIPPSLSDTGICQQHWQLLNGVMMMYDALEDSSHCMMNSISVDRHVWHLSVDLLACVNFVMRQLTVDFVNASQMDDHSLPNSIRNSSLKISAFVSMKLLFLGLEKIPAMVDKSILNKARPLYHGDVHDNKAQLNYLFRDKLLFEAVEWEWECWSNFVHQLFHIDECEKILVSNTKPNPSMETENTQHEIQRRIGCVSMIQKHFNNITDASNNIFDAHHAWLVPHETPDISIVRKDWTDIAGALPVLSNDITWPKVAGLVGVGIDPIPIQQVRSFAIPYIAEKTVNLRQDCAHWLLGKGILISPKHYSRISNMVEQVKPIAAHVLRPIITLIESIADDRIAQYERTLHTAFDAQSLQHLMSNAANVLSELIVLENSSVTHRSHIVK